MKFRVLIYDFANSRKRVALKSSLELIDVLKCEAYTPDNWRDLVQFPEIENAARHTRLNQEPKFALFISSEAMEFEGDDNDDVEWT